MPAPHHRNLIHLRRRRRGKLKLLVRRPKPVRMRLKVVAVVWRRKWRRLRQLRQRPPYGSSIHILGVR